MYEVYTSKHGLKGGKHFKKKHTAVKYAARHKHAKLFKLTKQ